MRFVKLFFISVVIFAIVIFLISLMFPSRLVIERTGVINAPMSKVYMVANDLKGWRAWNPWMIADSVAVIKFSEPASGTGAYYTWENNKPGGGSGKVTVSDSNPQKGIYYHMDFSNMKSVYSGLEMKPSTDGSGTAIHWYLETDLGWLPWWKFRGFMGDKLFGPQMEEGLNRLRALCEQP